jgi:TRAP-type uncharacterized transport system fused permease subunit
MGMPTSGVYVLLAALVAPSLVEAGVQPIAAHLFILYFGMMSMITPPVALAAYAAASISKADALATGFAAMRVGWAAFMIPFIFVSSPALLLEGDTVEMAVTMGLSMVGIVAVTAGIVGFWTRRLGLQFRAAFVLLGATALPLGFLPASDLLHLSAALAAIILAGTLVMTGRRRTGRIPI